MGTGQVGWKAVTLLEIKGKGAAFDVNQGKLKELTKGRKTEVKIIFEEALRRLRSL